MIRTSLLVLGMLLGLSLAAGWATAKPRSNWARHEAVCLRGEIAVCAQPVSQRSPVAVRPYRVQGSRTWRVAFDIETGAAGAAPICSCSRTADRSSVVLTCTCTGR
jgi:hypothetical protein